MDRAQARHQHSGTPEKAEQKPLLSDILTRTAPIDRDFGWSRGKPIDRYYIEAFLVRNSESIQGRVIEVGDCEYARRYGRGRVREITVFDVNESNPRATIVADLADASSLPLEIADCFICTQTLNLVFDIRAAILGVHRMLRPGGVLLATIPGISQIVEWDMRHRGDFWRLTTASAGKLFDLFEGGIQVTAFGNVLAAVAFLHGLAVEDLPEPSLLEQYDPNYQLVVSVAARK